MKTQNNWKKIDGEWINFDHFKFIRIEENFVGSNFYIVGYTHYDQPHKLYKFDTQQHADNFLDQIMTNL